MGGWSCAEARMGVLVYMAGGGISLGGNYDGVRGGQGGQGKNYVTISNRA